MSLLAVAVGLAGLAVGTPAVVSAHVDSPGTAVVRSAATSQDVVSLSPTRILDTRTGLGAPGPVSAGSPVDLLVVGAGGVPGSGVDSVVLNVTATAASQATFVTVWPAGEVQPTASVSNVVPNQAFANLVVAKVGAQGRVSLANGLGTVHLIADVVGWVPSGSGMVSLTPARILDTRNATGVPAAGRVGAGGVVEVAVTGVGGVPSSGVAGVWLNVTATGASGPTFVTAWPTGEPRPTASVLNVSGSAAVPNLVFARAGTGGAVSLYNDTNDVHLIADVVAYVRLGASVEAVSPDRIVDTRSGLGARAGRVGAGETLSVPVVGVSDVPEVGVIGVVANVTAVAPSATSFLTAWPTGDPQPVASTLNTQPGVTVANLALLPVGDRGAVSFYNDAGDLHLLVDVVGYLIDPDLLPNPAEVVSYSASASAYAGAGHVEPPDIRRSREEEIVWNLEADVDGERREQTTFYELVDGDGEDPSVETTIGLYEPPVGLDPAFALSAQSGPALAEALVYLELDVSAERNGMVIDTLTGGNSTASTPSDDPEERSIRATYHATAGINVTISEPMRLTVSRRCPLAGTDFRVFGAAVADSDGCIDPVVLQPGDYGFVVESRSSDAEHISSSFLDLVFTLRPAD